MKKVKGIKGYGSYVVSVSQKGVKVGGIGGRYGIGGGGSFMNVTDSGSSGGYGFEVSPEPYVSTFSGTPIDWGRHQPNLKEVWGVLGKMKQPVDVRKLFDIEGLEMNHLIPKDQENFNKVKTALMNVYLGEIGKIAPNLTQEELMKGDTNFKIQSLVQHYKNAVVQLYNKMKANKEVYEKDKDVRNEVMQQVGKAVPISSLENQMAFINKGTLGDYYSTASGDLDYMRVIQDLSGGNLKSINLGNVYKAQSYNLDKNISENVAYLTADKETFLKGLGSAGYSTETQKALTVNKINNIAISGLKSLMSNNQNTSDFYAHAVKYLDKYKNTNFWNNGMSEVINEVNAGRTMSGEKVYSDLLDDYARVANNKLNDLYKIDESGSSFMQRAEKRLQELNSKKNLTEEEAKEKQDIINKINKAVSYVVLGKARVAGMVNEEIMINKEEYEKIKTRNHANVKEHNGKYYLIKQHPAVGFAIQGNLVKKKVELYGSEVPKDKDIDAVINQKTDDVIIKKGNVYIGSGKYKNKNQEELIAEANKLNLLGSQEYTDIMHMNTSELISLDNIFDSDNNASKNYAMEGVLADYINKGVQKVYTEQDINVALKQMHAVNVSTGGGGGGMTLEEQKITEHVVLMTSVLQAKFNMEGASGEKIFKSSISNSPPTFTSREDKNKVLSFFADGLAQSSTVLQAIDKNTSLIVYDKDGKVKTGENTNNVLGITEKNPRNAVLSGATACVGFKTKSGELVVLEDADLETSLTNIMFDKKLLSEESLNNSKRGKPTLLSLVAFANDFYNANPSLKQSLSIFKSKDNEPPPTTLVDAIKNSGGNDDAKTNLKYALFDYLLKTSNFTILLQVKTSKNKDSGTSGDTYYVQTGDENTFNVLTTFSSRQANEDFTNRYNTYIDLRNFMFGKDNNNDNKNYNYVDWNNSNASNQYHNMLQNYIQKQNELKKPSKP